MRLMKLSAFALVAMSLLSTDTLASPVDRKFHPVVNDDPQNAHLNVQTPGADINQTVVIKEEPGPDGQVIPAGDTKIASCVGKDANGDIDLSGGGSCSPSTASAPIAERATTTVPTIGRTLSPSPRAASRTIRVPSLTSASAAPAGSANASRSVPNHTVHTVAAARVAAPLPAHRTETARAVASSLPGKQLAAATRPNAAHFEFARVQWLEIALAAAMLVALGLGLMFRMGLGGLLRMRRHAGEEHAARDGRTAVSAVVGLGAPQPD